MAASIIHGFAGLLHAAAATAVIHGSRRYNLSALTAFIVWLVLAWPTAMSVGKIAIASRRLRWMLPLVLTVVIVALSGPALSVIILLWTLYVLPALILIVAVGSPRWRSAGLFVFPSLFVIIACTRNAMIEGGASGWWLAIPAAALSLGMVVLCLQAIAWWYRKKHTSDLDLTLDLQWALLTVWQGFCLAASVGRFSIYSFIPFAFYKIAVFAGRKIAQRLPTENHRLLLLRTFGARGRSERLLDEFSVHWRRVGSIQLIGAPDVAGANLDAQAFLAFITGHARQFFITDQAGLARRLADLDNAPDPDGRFRVNEFYCFDQIWADAVRQLIEQNTAVLMDLRAFSRQRSGCVNELRLLFDHVPLDRVVFLTDATTQRSELENLLQSIWRECPESSPNRALRTVEIIHATTGRSGATRALLQHVCAAATAPGRC